MKDKIIEVANDLFLSFGFKSVTMDDIANKIGVSKKTIYKYFKNKTELVDVVTNHTFDTIACGIELIFDKDLNPIEQIFSIKRLVMEHLKDEKSSPQYQLQKYYPETFASLKEKQFVMMQECIIDNLRIGIEKGFYRDNINLEFISRIYFIGLTGIKDKDFFPLDNYSMNDLMNYYLEYHMRGICTEKGIQQLENQLKY